MKNVVIAIFLLMVTHLGYAQGESFDYENPFFNFQNIDSLQGVDPNSFSKVDLQKLTYVKEVNEDGETRFNAYIPFYVNKRIEENNDFGLIFSGSIYHWSLLNEKKEPLVKSFRKILDNEGNIIGIQQYNEDLKVPIMLPGKYFLKLIVEQVPEEERLAWVWIGKIDKRDGIMGYNPQN